jgi:hypothetical protein
MTEFDLVFLVNPLLLVAAAILARTAGEAGALRGEEGS